MQHFDSSNISRRRLLKCGPLGLLGICTSAWLTLGTQQAEALPHDRRVSRRTSRRTSRRVTRRRHFFGMPPGAAPFLYGGYRYFVAGGLYYYPYMFGGRTIYVQVDVTNGHPLPPPPPSQVSVEIDL